MCYAGMYFDPILRRVLLQYQNVFCSNTKMCFDPYCDVFYSNTIMHFAPILQCILNQFYVQYSSNIHTSIGAKYILVREQNTWQYCIKTHSGIGIKYILGLEQNIVVLDQNTFWYWSKIHSCIGAKHIVVFDQNTVQYSSKIHSSIEQNISQYWIKHILVLEQKTSSIGAQHIVVFDQNTFQYAKYILLLEHSNQYYDVFFFNTRMYLLRCQNVF